MSNATRQLCASCNHNTGPVERRQYWPVLPPPTLPVLPSDMSRAAIAARRAAVRAAWKQGYSQAAIARATGLARQTVWAYINTEQMR